MARGVRSQPSVVIVGAEAYRQFLAIGSFFVDRDPDSAINRQGLGIPLPNELMPPIRQFDNVLSN